MQPLIKRRLFCGTEFDESTKLWPPYDALFRLPLSVVSSLTVCSQLDFSVSDCRGQGSHFLYQQEDSQPTRTATTAS